MISFFEIAPFFSSLSTDTRKGFWLKLAISRVSFGVIRLALFFLICFSLKANGNEPIGVDKDLGRLSLGNTQVDSTTGFWTTILRGQSADSLIAEKGLYEWNLGNSKKDWDDLTFHSDYRDSYNVDHFGTSTLYVPKQEVLPSPISVSSQYGWKGTRDEYGEVYVLYGDCRVSQRNGNASSPIAVIWINKRVEEDGASDLGTIVHVYLEGSGDQPLALDLEQVCSSAKIDGDAWLGRFQSLSQIDLRIALPGKEQINPDEVYYRALDFIKREVKLERVNDSNNIVSGLSLNESLESKETSLLKTTEIDSISSNASVLSDGRTVVGWSEIGSGDSVLSIPETVERQYHEESVSYSKNRSRVERLKFKLLNRYEETPKDVQRTGDNGDKSSWIISNGFTLIVQGLDLQDMLIGDTLELSADSAVVWTSINPGTDEIVPADLDYEIYLDGNVIFREGNSVVYAKKMYYDIKNRVGIIENAEMLAETPGMSGVFFRLGADRIVQETEDVLRASNAWVSTSMMGRPTYRLQTDSLVMQRSRSGLYDAMTGKPYVDPKTGLQATSEKQFVIAENNFVTVGNLPVFYWPWMAMDIKDRALYLKSFKLGHDGVLGSQIRSSWDLYQLFQIKNRPAGTEWSLDLDYLSKRGVGHGSTFRYERDSLWNWNSRAVGLMNFYGIYDKGLDNLGHERRNLSFEHEYRYRGIWKHKQEFGFGKVDCDWLNESPWTFVGQIGKSSDRNFIPEYFEDEWNSSSNPETRFELKRTNNNNSLGLNFALRTDDFYTQTNWLPKLDHYWIGQSLFNSPFVWYEHTKIGYAQFKTTNSPYDLNDAELFRYLDWELSSDSTSNVAKATGTSVLTGEGLVFSSRQEIDVPFQLGPVKTTPYALGEYGFWGQGMEGDNISRLYGRVGVRFNLPIWKVDSEVESQTWYVNGVAHKMNFVVDASYSDANKNFNDLILFDQVDDWQVQDFRRRNSLTTFFSQGQAGLDAIPVRFDERYYAIRQGVLGGNVASVSTEAVDDLQLVRLGWNNRWQTKRGPVGSRRVVDWITLNAGINLYPKDNENFGKIPGLLDYDACWQIGDRFAVLSSGLYDFWGSGQKITRIGVQHKRPSLSSCYLGIDRLSGPIDSTYLNLGLTYRTSEKWGIGFSNSFDLSEGYNIGQKLTISRIGESFVVTLGASRNESKDNWGVNLSIEPVFFFDKEKREEGLLGLGNM